MLTGTISGRWWLPDTPKLRIPGLLYLAYGRLPRVDLAGQLEETDLVEAFQNAFGGRKHFPVVLGESWDRRAISLWDARVSIEQMHVAAPDEADTKVEASCAFVGGLFPDPSVRFRQLRLRIEHLLEFLDARPIQRDWSRSRGPGMKFVDTWRRASIETHRTAEARMDIGVGARQTGDRMYAATIEQWADAVVYPRAGLPFGLLREKYAAPLVDLLTFATGRPCAVDLVTVQQRRGDREPEVEVIWHRPSPAANRDDLRSDELLFRLSDVPAAGGSVVARWFDVAAQLTDVLRLFLGTRYASFMYEQNRFLNLVQAVETLHRVKTGEFRPTRRRSASGARRWWKLRLGCTANGSRNSWRGVGVREHQLSNQVVDGGAALPGRGRVG